MSHDDFQTEPVRGLPQALPPGEVILWQGAPSWRRLAWRGFGVRLVLGYFAILGLWRIIDATWAGAGLVSGLLDAAILVPVAAAAVAVLAVIARFAARTTVYTITNARVAMRIGIALTLTLNLPFSRISAVALRRDADGVGDIVLTLAGPDRMAYLALWPHVRPWRLNRAEPMLRSLADVDTAARILTEALRAAVAAKGPAAAAQPATPKRLARLPRTRMARA